jgi:hypothetical protein
VCASDLPTTPLGVHETHDGCGLEVVPFDELLARSDFLR